MLRRYTPKGLYARTFLIVVLPIFLMQAVITYVFFNRHWEEVSGNLSANTAGDIALITKLYRQAGNDDAREQVRELARNDLDIAIRYAADEEIPPNDKRGFFSVLDSTIDEKLDNALDLPYWYNTAGFPAYVEVRVQLSDGTLRFIIRRERVFTDNAWIFIVWLIGATGLLGYVSFISMSNQVRSILRLAEAADAFGRGKDIPDYRPSGAREVRAAGHAFLAMKKRINRYIDQRTAMLAGVSHDLRTPLTRMKLALALMPPSDEVDELKSDVDEMEQMLAEYLNFSRDQAKEEPVLFDLSSLLEEIASDTERAGYSVQLESSEPLEIDARRQALKRAIGNLVTNSVKYASSVKISTSCNDDHVDIIVDDDGPGIELELHEEAFKPFSRLDDSRTQNIAGVGLGLAVVKDVARAHGGDIALDRSPMGGLRATFKLPL